MSASHPRKRNRISKMILMILGVLLGFIALEAGVRLWGRDYVSAGIYIRSKTRSYALKPNTHFVSDTGVPNFINSLGLPEREIPPAKPKGEYRILVLGDSATHNADVPYEERFTSILEKKLNRRFSGRTFKVINAGVTGYNVEQMAALYREVGHLYGPDYVILHCLIRESSRRSLVNRAFLELPPFVQDAVIFTYDHSALVRKVRIMALNAMVNVRFGDLNVSSSVGEFKDSPGWNKTKEVLSDLKRQLESQNIPFALLLFTYLQNVQRFKAHYQEFESFGRSAGISAISTWRYFEGFGEDLSQFWVSPDDSHPNAKANAVIADHLVDFFPRVIEEAVEAPRPRADIP